MKRTPLKRKTPMARGKPLEAKKRWDPPRSRIKSRSDRNRQEGEVRRAYRETLEDRCRICPILRSLGIETHCAGCVQGLHERRKAGAGGSKINPQNLWPSCNWGNTFLEDAVGDDRKKIEASCLVVRPGDPEWELLGRRADKA